MSEYFKQITLGLDVLFGDERTEVKRLKTTNVKKDLRVAKTIRKTSIIQRSTNRVQRIAKEALS